MISLGSTLFRFLALGQVSPPESSPTYDKSLTLNVGYRHVRLLSNLGEALENATLFVHVAMSEKWGGEVMDLYKLYLVLK